MEINVTDENFEQEVLQSNVPVLVDFWAPWCAPCLIVAPVVEKIAKEYGEKLKVCKVNVDEARSVARKYNVMSIPTLMVFKEGSQVKTSIGALPESVLKNLISPFI
ncbi:MAG: thioredoxin [Candidatus Theseobacter exili]|nr:thioredoxin [Candidatus Theseobacter exili]